MRIREVMTQAVVTAEASDTLERVGQLMRDRNVGSVVVCDGGRAVGVITDRDLALAIAADGVGVEADAGGYASRPLVTGDVEMDIEEAVALMIQHRIRRLPVTDAEDLAGIVTILLPPAGRLSVALTADQRRRREQVEGVIRLMAPALNLVLAAGERLSKIVEPQDTEYYPPRVTEEKRPPSGESAQG
jgi:CBS-domain-containing membrane protein